MLFTSMIFPYFCVTSNIFYKDIDSCSTLMSKKVFIGKVPLPTDHKLFDMKTFLCRDQTNISYSKRVAVVAARRDSPWWTSQPLLFRRTIIFDGWSKRLSTRR